MVEHTIHDDAYPELVCMLDQVIPVFLGAEVGIDLVIILGIVTVIGGRVEDGVEVKGIHPKRSGNPVTGRCLSGHHPYNHAHVALLCWAPVRRSSVETPGAVGVAIGIIPAVSLR